MNRVICGALLILTVIVTGCGSEDPSGPESVHDGVVRRVPIDHETVTAALLACLPGDTVLVAPGTYLESYLPLTDGVLLRGETGVAADVVLNAQQGGTVLNVIDLDEGARVEHLTLTGGHGQYAGGVRIENAAVTLANCVITANISKTSGGGIMCSKQGEVILLDCVIHNNSVTGYRGGGLWLGDESTASLIGCTITGNSAQLGGGLLCGSGASVTVTDCTITGNLARTQGGGVYLEGWGDFLAEGMFVRYNIAPIAPDGVFNANSPSDELTAVLRCCDIETANWLGAEGLTLENDDCP